MPFYNASQAAKRIGVSDKTVRRWLAQGKITATKTKTGQLAIAASEVERLRQEVEQERTLFIMPGPILTSLDSTRYEQTADVESVVEKLEDKFTVLGQQFVELRAIVTTQAAKIQILQQKVETLHSIAIDAKNRPVSVPSTQNTSVPAKGPEIASTEARNTVPAELPSGTVSAIEFAAWHNVHRTTIRRHCTSGIQGDRIETIERPKPGGRTGDKERFLTEQQQRAAIAFWKRHDVAFTECDQAGCYCHTLKQENE